MLSWLQQIDTAKSPLEVVAITRDYLASWRPDELALLPALCRPGRVKDEQDIEQLHGGLVDEYRRNQLNGDALSALQRITSVIVRASVRIAQIRGEEEGAADQEDETARPAGPPCASARER